MSIEHVQNEIQRFIRTKDPEVLCISGGWGVGKTFAWKKMLEEEGKLKKVALDSYAYVSLFGLNSLNDLKRAIFHNTVPTNSSNGGPNAASIAKQVSDTFEGSKKYIGSLGGLFGSKGVAVASLIEDLSFAAINQRLVCIDDLERAGENLKPRDILGLANFLKEERGCKVVILMNDEQLRNADEVNFNAQFEKVVDIGLRFEPSATEVVRIALDDNTKTQAVLGDVFIKIGCRNIRLIKRAERLIARLDRPDLSENERFQFCHTVAIATYIHFGDEPDWSLERLRVDNAYNPLNQNDELEDGLRDFLETQNYAGSEELDLVLIDAVEKGFADRDKLEKKLADKRNYIRLHGNDNAFSKAWAYFHNNLDHTPAEFRQRLIEAVDAEPEAVSLSNINGTLQILDEMGYEGDAQDLAERYFAARDFTRDDLVDDVFLWRNIDGVHPAIIGERDRLNEEFVDHRDAAEVVALMAKNEGWNNEDWLLLNRLSVEEIVELLDRMTGSGLTAKLRWLARFAGDDGDQFQPFGTRLVEAASLIGQRSPSVRMKLQAVNLISSEA